MLLLAVNLDNLRKGESHCCHNITLFFKVTIYFKMYVIMYV